MPTGTTARRAWVAVQALDLVLGRWELATLVPRFGDPFSGWFLLLGASLLSVLIGTGRIWPGSAEGVVVPARVALLAANATAVVLVGPVLSAFPSAALLDHAIYGAEPGEWPPKPGLVNDGKTVSNVFAYDAAGQPLTGVQLYDQAGRPLALDADAFGKVRTGEGPGLVYPWLNGSQQLWNVFPLPVRAQRGWHRPDRVWSSDRPPVLAEPPLAVVPPASLPPVSQTPR